MACFGHDVLLLMCVVVLCDWLICAPVVCDDVCVYCVCAMRVVALFDWLLLLLFGLMVRCLRGVYLCCCVCCVAMSAVMCAFLTSPRRDMMLCPDYWVHGVR